MSTFQNFNMFMSLTSVFILTHSTDTECGISSGSSLFAKYLITNIQNEKQKKLQTRWGSIDKITEKKHKIFLC